MLAALSSFGLNSGAIWMFGAGVIAVLFVAALIVTAIEFINQLIK
jgi:hypothetical protein